MSATLPLWYKNCEDLRVYDVPETTSYIQSLADIYDGTRRTLKCYYRSFERYDPNGTRSFASEFIREIPLLPNQFSVADALIVLAAAAIWTIARNVTVNGILRPIASYAGIFEKNVSRFCECSWKGTAYLGLWLCAYYITFHRGYTFHTNPMSVFFQGNDAERAPLDLTIMMFLEGSFYAHSFYATLYMDAWRKDSLPMMSHHVVTLVLILGAYICGLYQTPVLIYLLDDIGDVILEYTKVCSYVMDRKSGHSKLFSITGHSLSVVFALQWFVLRIYFHVTLIWRVASLGPWYSMQKLPAQFHIHFIILFGLLYVLYVYWFCLILLFVKRILSGRHVDPREDDGAELESKKTE